MRVLMITSEWPTTENPNLAPFVVREYHNLLKAGISVDLFTFRGGSNLLWYFRNWLKLRIEKDLSSYDLFHAQWGQSALLILPKTRPLVITFRGSDLEGIVGKNGKYTYQGKVLQIISKLMARQANQVILVSNSLSRFIPHVPYHLISGGIDLKLFTPSSKKFARERLGMPKDQKMILFASDPYRPEKRYGLAVKALELLNNRAKLIVTKNIKFEDMPLYMNACDILLVTSNHEGSPNVVKEALACNLPIVSTDVGDVRQRIGNIEGCIVCANDEPETIALALKHALLRDKRINGRDTVLDLDESLHVQRVIAVYEKALYS